MTVKKTKNKTQKTKTSLKKKKNSSIKKRKTEKKSKKQGEKSKLPKKEKSLLKKYIDTIGRRKRSTARIRFSEEKEILGKIIINNKDCNVYFPQEELQKIVYEPINKTNSNILKKGGITILTKGGGKRGQAEAIRLGIAKVILAIDEKLKKILKANSLLTRDPRKKERKKFGLKKARKAPQWQKR